MKYSLLIKFVLLIVFIHISLEDQGQNKRMIDSLIAVSNTKIPDTNTIYNYIDIAWEYNGAVPAKSDSFARMAFHIATKIRFKQGVAMSLYALGENYFKQCNYTLALTYLFESANMFEDLKDNKRSGIVYTTIGSVFIDSRNLDKALEYNRKALTFKIKSGSKKSIAISYMNIGNVYQEKKEYNMALDYYFRSMKIVEETNDLKTQAQLFNNLGISYRIQGRYKESLDSYLKSLEIKSKTGNQRGISVTYFNIGLLYNYLKKPAEALKFFELSKQYAEKTNSLEDLKNAYKGLSDSYAGLGNYKNAYDNFQQFYVLNDSIYGIKNLEKFAEMQTKFETRKKEKEIEILIKEKQIQQYQNQQTIIIIVSVSSFFVLLLIMFMVTLNYRRQKRNRREIIRQIIETEEKERRHFAEDLHDGLGPLLSSVSLYVNELSNEQLEKPKKEKITKVACELIDDAISSARIIANNLTPGMLRDYGLLPALESFCKKVNATQTLDIKIDDKTNHKRYHNIIETTLYRVGLEMINNTVKYARARNINISLTEKSNILYFAYNDDGQGFDYEKKKNDINKGLGLNNILNRLHSINGKCEIISSPGKGFQAFLEIPLKYLQSLEL